MVISKGMETGMGTGTEDTKVKDKDLVSHRLRQDSQGGSIKSTNG
jgi:hypothetical protein